MHYPTTPSSSRTRAPTTPPSASYTVHGLSTPGAPYMSHADLPSSSNTPAHHHRTLPPATPHLGTVPLPPQGYSPYGLLTPPASPPSTTRHNGQPDLNAVLHPNYPAFRFDMRFPVHHIQFAPNCPPSVLDAAATTPGTTTMEIIAFFDTIRLVVTRRRASVVTVRDVLEKVYEEMNKRADALQLMRLTQAEGVPLAAQGNASRRVDMLAPHFCFGGLVPTNVGWSLVVKQ